ncbi:flagellar hook-basal body complex protein FliE [Nocardioides sp.]|uniref:flagellar hook-basal body complex protein FliE n=1 Tax=Nocardioides sp. TaxID=35761 RepID=UPI0027340E73|nr:flagellar hook-basal body complex protein FliE [Nocardioides sp.]MDP3890240.1 flagellar hook-basal body complex protein FliE [Nocardioides sp.]
MSVAGIEGLGGAGFTPYVAPQVGPQEVATSGRAAGTAGPEGPAFGDFLIDGLDRLQGIQQKADGLAVQAATGDLTNIHDYTIAATEAAVTTQLTVAVRNKAVEAFTEIMRMHVG